MKLKDLSKSAPIEVSFLRVTRFTFGFLGFWPEVKVTFLLRIRVLVNLIALSIGAFGEAGFAFYNIDKLTLALDAVCPSTTKLVTLLKLIIFYVYRKELGNLIVKMREFMLKDTNAERRQIMQKLSSTAAIFSFTVFMFGNSTNAFYAIRPIVSNIIDYAHGNNLTNDLPFRIVLPESYKTYPRYPIMFFILFYSGVVTVFGFGGSDGCFMGFCCHIASAFRVIQYDIKSVLNDIKESTLSKYDNEIYYQRLRIIVIKHMELIQLCKEFSAYFIVITLAHFASASIVICISSINLIMSSGVDSLLYISYNLAVLTQLYVYCAGGNYLLESSRNVAEVAYFTEWYKCDVRIRKMILMVIIRASKGTGVEVPFFQPSLPAYGTILSTAGSYITLLKTFL